MGHPARERPVAPEGLLDSQSPAAREKGSQGHLQGHCRARKLRLTGQTQEPKEAGTAPPTPSTASGLPGTLLLVASYHKTSRTHTDHHSHHLLYVTSDRPAVTKAGAELTWRPAHLPGASAGPGVGVWSAPPHSCTSPGPQRHMERKCLLLLKRSASPATSGQHGVLHGVLHGHRTHRVSGKRCSTPSFGKPADEWPLAQAAGPKGQTAEEKPERIDVEPLDPTAKSRGSE
ncbi:hypothetical protein PAL_GLEAN10005297 [Pteropus alecto]|uniref:Uncharacterized protein n=1 Tax=Pteropus alecto TaxID=9402 RepID=L5JWN3_PTEAL|nr:hypothetical protein PAL_GLEAN10005297 [Pteropus alecto]